VNDFSVVVVPPLVDEMHMPPRINISLQLHYHQFLLMQSVLEMIFMVIERRLMSHQEFKVLKIVDMVWIQNHFPKKKLFEDRTVIYQVM
jgi:hypothetical protein